VPVIRPERGRLGDSPMPREARWGDSAHSSKSRHCRTLATLEWTVFDGTRQGFFAKVGLSRTRTSQGFVRRFAAAI
jgi:hypothetical protein